MLYLIIMKWVLLILIFIILLLTIILIKMIQILLFLPDFWFGILNLIKPKELKKKTSEELMPVSWHLNRWWNFFLLEDEKKEIESSLILVQMYQNIYLKIFKTICSNISCITKISKPKCFNPFSIKLLCSFLEIALWHACSPVNLLHIIRTPFPYNFPGGLLPALRIIYIYIYWQY